MEAEFDVQDFDDRNVMSAKGNFARFYIYPEKDEVASAEAGRPIYKDVEYIEIMSGGSRNNIVVRAALEMDKARFREQYRRFKESGVDTPSGTLLREIPWLGASNIKELEYMNVRTLEQLAELNDGVCTQNPGFFELKRKAVLWLEKSEAAAPFTKLEQENAALRARLDSLESASKLADQQTKKDK